MSWVLDAYGFASTRVEELMAGSFENSQAHFAEVDSLSIFQRSEGVFRFCGGTQVNFCSDAIAEFEMAGDEVGV